MCPATVGFAGRCNIRTRNNAARARIVVMTLERRTQDAVAWQRIKFYAPPLIKLLPLTDGKYVPMTTLTYKTPLPLESSTEIILAWGLATAAE